MDQEQSTTNNLDTIVHIECDTIVKSLQRFGRESVFYTEAEIRQPLQNIMDEFAMNGPNYKESFILDNLSHQGKFEKKNSNKVLGLGNIKNYSNKKQFKNSLYGSHQFCVFCENNNESEHLVRSHAVRDSHGRVLCPKLRTYICPICGASGDYAHTLKYCPDKPIITMADTIKREKVRLVRASLLS